MSSIDLIESHLTWSVKCRNRKIQWNLFISVCVDCELCSLFNVKKKKRKKIRNKKKVNKKIHRPIEINVLWKAKSIKNVDKIVQHICEWLFGLFLQFRFSSQVFGSIFSLPCHCPRYPKNEESDSLHSMTVRANAKRTSHRIFYHHFSPAHYYAFIFTIKINFRSVIPRVHLQIHLFQSENG